jgi:hypothetical protein
MEGRSPPLPPKGPNQRAAADRPPAVPPSLAAPPRTHAWVRFLHQSTGPAFALLAAFFVWWLCMVIFFFDPAWPLWVNTLVITAFVGTALNVNAFTSSQEPHLLAFARNQPWLVARFFLIPFCVSSYGGIADSAHFVAAFPSTHAVSAAVGICVAVFVALLMLLAHRLT